MKNKKENYKKMKQEMIASVPEDIKIIYGKFTLFSIAYLVFFFAIYPFYLMYRINAMCSIIVFIILILFYIYMIIDVWKKKKTYLASGYVLLIPLVFVAISFSIIKFIF